MRVMAMVAVASLSSCWSEEWIVTDRRGLGSTQFFGRVTNFDGMVMSQASFGLNPSGTTKLTVNGSPPNVELRDVTVLAWADRDGTRDCERDCMPQPGDTVVTLTGINWPWVYEIELNP